jgi:hypothetical protein
MFPGDCYISRGVYVNFYNLHHASDQFSETYRQAEQDKHMFHVFLLYIYHLRKIYDSFVKLMIWMLYQYYQF